MIPPSGFIFARQRIVVVGEESVVNTFVISTLRYDGHCVTQTVDSASVPSDLGLGDCHLVIVGSELAGPARAELLDEVRAHRPVIALLCLTRGSARAGEGWRAPERVAVLEEPFTAEQLQSAVRPLLPQLRGGSVLALAVEELRVRAHDRVHGRQSSSSPA